MRIAEHHGQVIEMDPQDWYVRGHGTRAEAHAAVATHCECGDEETPDLGPIRHVWGRWQPAGETDGHEWEYTWHTRLDPAPGWARVTRVYEAGEWRDLEETEAVRYAARQWATRMWPDAEVHRIAAFPWRDRDRATVTVVLPRHHLRCTLRPWSACSPGWVRAIAPGMSTLRLRDAIAIVGLRPLC